MIFAEEQKPVLIFSLDEIDVTEEDLADAMSGNAPDVSDFERYSKSNALSKFLESDVFRKALRIPIVIDEEELPVHHSGSGTSTRKAVDYDNDEPIITNNSNSVSVRFAIKSSLTTLSTVSDIFHAIADKIFPRWTVSPRVSFFSKTVCIYNGYLVGVSRQTEANSDREIMVLTFERSKNQVEAEETEEIEPDKEDGFILKPSEVPPSATPPEEGVQAQTTNAGGASNGRLFYWYKIADMQTIENSPVPQIYSVSNVNREPYQILISKNLNFDSEEITLITVQYLGLYLPLYLNDHNPYYKPNLDDSAGYAIYSDGELLWLGVEFREE